jgi:hypothetical protein
MLRLRIPGGPDQGAKIDPTRVQQRSKASFRRLEKFNVAIVPDFALSNLAMPQNSYDLDALLAKSERWRIKASRATLPSMRAFCLSEAERWDRMVQRSMAVPVLGDNASGAQSGGGSDADTIDCPREFPAGGDIADYETAPKPTFRWVKPSKAR